MNVTITFHWIYQLAQAINRKSSYLAMFGLAALETNPSVPIASLIFLLLSSTHHALSLLLRIPSKPLPGANQLFAEQPFNYAKDEWLEIVGKESVFQTAEMVVDHFLSPSKDKSKYPLRKIHTFNVQLNKEDADVDTTSRMFDPLFGPCNELYHNHEPTFSSNRKRVNLKLTVAYRGADFCGWEDQRHHLYRKEREGNNISDQSHELPSVQGTLVDVLDPILSNSISRTKKQLAHNNTLTESKARPIEIKVAGRTDAGVSAIAQVCRIRTQRTDFLSHKADGFGGIETFIKDLVNAHTEQLRLGLRITDLNQVGDDFHPTFGASCRAYAYIIDFEGTDVPETKQPRRTHGLVAKLDAMLRSLEGQALNYVAFSYGKVKTQTTICTLLRARACIVEYKLYGSKNSPDELDPSVMRQALCIELVGDRFLRRMVRILVATALREAWIGSSVSEVADNVGQSESSLISNVQIKNVLLDIVKTRDRTNSAPPAPAQGLIFIGAGYT